MTSPFEIAGGSVVGTDHRAVPKNNQDAWHVARKRDATVAVVCDGCGSGRYSEIGARLGAVIIAERLASWMEWPQPILESLRLTEMTLLQHLRNVAGDMTRYRETIEEHFLFTVVGIAITTETVAFFGLGDGVFGVNGPIRQLVSFENAPTYLAYRLIPENVDIALEALHLNILASYPTSYVENFLIGCDGAGRPGLLDVCEQDRKLPGMEKTVGPISQFWEDDAIFSNPAIVSRRLKLIARDWPPRDPEHGLLPDDTTIVVGRRR